MDWFLHDNGRRHERVKLSFTALEVNFCRPSAKAKLAEW